MVDLIGGCFRSKSPFGFAVYLVMNSRWLVPVEPTPLACVVPSKAYMIAVPPGLPGAGWRLESYAGAS
jgi:hypothetical protein